MRDEAARCSAPRHHRSGSPKESASRRDASARAGEWAGTQSARIPSGCDSFFVVDQGWEAADDAASHPWLIFRHPYGMPASSLGRATTSTLAFAARRLDQRPLLYAK